LSAVAVEPVLRSRRARGFASAVSFFTAAGARC
jgi:hypothetical protein